jgi:rubredoxin
MALTTAFVLPLQRLGAWSGLGRVQVPKSTGRTRGVPVRICERLQAEAPRTTSAGGSVVVQRVQVAAAPAIDPRRPARQRKSSEQHRQQQNYQGYESTTPPRPVGRTSVGFIISFVVLGAALGTAGFFGVQRFRKQRELLLAEYGEEMVEAIQFVERRSEDTPDEERLMKELTEVTRVYKAKAPLWGQKRRMYASFLYALVRNVKLTVGSILAVRVAQQVLGVSQKTTVEVMNALAQERLASAPTLLSKLLLLSERLNLDAKNLRIRDKFSFSAEVVNSLQQNLRESCYRDVLEGRIQRMREARGETPLTAADLAGPMQDEELERFRRRRARAALDAELAESLLKSDFIPQGYEILGFKESEARGILQAFLSDKEQAVEEACRDIEARERTLMTRMRETANESSEETSSKAGKPSGHRFECQRCGYTLFPAAGREWKFYGDNFTCPQCGAPKSEFRDASENP